MTGPTRIIAGNWKMNGTGESLDEARAVAEALAQSPAAVRVALCPPATLIWRMKQALGAGPVEIGGQDCHAEREGAFTGDVSAEMLTDAGARLVILGHSERRALHGETDAVVSAKVLAALAAGLEPIICVGETLAEREAGQAEQVVERQLLGSLPEALAGQAFALAYEPVWAIGTGRVAEPADIGTMHAHIRAVLARHLGDSGDRAPILYGGSVKPSNAAETLSVAEVGGALVGGASLKATDFLGIIRAA